MTTPDGSAPPTLDAIAADPRLAQEVSRAALEELALRAIAAHAVIVTVLLAGPGTPDGPRRAEGDDHEEDRLLTVPEVAQRLGVPAPYVYELARRREIPTCRFGRYVRIPAHELRQWIQKRRVDSGPRAVRQFARAKAR
jgi:excisionase family DNA binding protein